MNIKWLFKKILGFFRCVCGNVKYSKNVYIGRHVHFVNGKNIVLGRNVQIRPDVDLFAGEIFTIGDGSDIGTRNRIVGNIVIGDNVLFGPDNYICSSDHNYRDVNVPIINQGVSEISKGGKYELKIGTGSWIGTHVAIIGCVHIGKNCVIGANSVVTKDVPDYCVVVGSPAKIIKQYDLESKTWKKVD